MKTTLAALVSVLLAAAPAAAELTRIGAAGAVAGSVRAAAAGAAGRALKSGEPVYLNDRITTDASGRMQVLLLDQTVFTVGPASDIVLDEFVYDPATSAGKVSAKVAKGVFRFVTGKVARQDPANMKVTLPVGTIGIRGTIAGGRVTSQDSTVVLLGPGAGNDANEAPGAVEVANEGGGVTLDRPGYGTTITQGQRPAAPSDMRGFADQLAADLGPAATGAGSQSGAGGASASEESGAATASGNALAGESGEIAAVTEDLGAESNKASQEVLDGGIPDGVSQWDHLRSIPTGIGLYSASGGYTCISGTCSTGASGAMSFTLQVDFGARTYGGGSSAISLTSGLLNGENTAINQTSFASLTGLAVVTLTQASGNINAAANGSFDNSTIKFTNVGGKAAADATLDLNYAHSSGATADALVTAPRSGP